MIERRSAYRFGHVALGLAGLAATLAMLRHTDLHALRAFGPWAVFALLIEGLRVIAEAMATRTLHGPSVRVPWGPLLRAHAAGYALAMTMPAGRTVAEAAKAVMLSRWVERSRSVGVAATNQSLVMASTGTVAVVCSLAAWSLGHVALAGAVALQALALLVSGGGLLAMVRSRTIAGRVGARFPKIAAMADGASEGARAPGVPAALGFFVLHRGIQSVQLFVMLGALGRWDVTCALGLAGALIVGTSVGVAVPGQLGAVGASLALGAPGLGVPAAQALAMALVIHAGQFGWSALGLAIWTVTRGDRDARG